MEKKITPGDYFRLWAVGITVLICAFLLALCLIACNNGKPTARLRKRMWHVTEGMTRLCGLDSMELLKA